MRLIRLAANEFLLPKSSIMLSLLVKSGLDDFPASAGRTRLVFSLSESTESSKED